MTTRITRVTLTEDRAHVRREGRISLRAGSQQLVIDGASPVLVDKTLRASTEDSSVRVLDMRVRRQRLHRTEDYPPDLAELEIALVQKRSERTKTEAELSRLQVRRDAIRQMRSQSLRELSIDAAAGSLDSTQAQADFHRLETEERGLCERLTRLQRELTEIDQIAQRIAERKALIPDSHRETATITLHLASERDLETQLVLEYIVPGACWRPYHVAQLEHTEHLERSEQLEHTEHLEHTDDYKIAFTSEACVWQATGEDWIEAELVFSTERPSLGKNPPRLNDDPLAVIPKRKYTQVETREQQIHDVGPGPSPSASKPAVPGIDDGGEIRRLEALRPATVPSDGRPHRFPLFVFESRVERETRLMPELASVAFERTIQTNDSPHPLLAGPVDLIRNKGLIGRTKLLYVAPGARFELSWGAVPEIRVSRTHDESSEESSMLSSWSTKKNTVEIKLSNLSDRPRPLTLIERIPVSEIEGVQIQFDATKTSGGASPDRDGFVRWNLVLSPSGRETRELRYVVKRRSDVVGL